MALDRRFVGFGELALLLAVARLALRLRLRFFARARFFEETPLRLLFEAPRPKATPPGDSAATAAG